MPAEVPPLPAEPGRELPWNTGSLLRPSGMLVGVISCNCGVETTVSGVGELAASAMMRLPVTATVSNGSVCCGASAEVCAAGRGHGRTLRGGARSRRIMMAPEAEYSTTRPVPVSSRSSASLARKLALQRPARKDPTPDRR